MVRLHGGGFESMVGLVPQGGGGGRGYFAGGLVPWGVVIR